MNSKIVWGNKIVSAVKIKLDKNFAPRNAESGIAIYVIRLEANEHGLWVFNANGKLEMSSLLKQNPTPRNLKVGETVDFPEKFRIHPIGNQTVSLTYTLVQGGINEEIWYYVLKLS